MSILQKVLGAVRGARWTDYGLNDGMLLVDFANYGSILCFSVEVILRAEAVETAQAGDKCDFTGTLIVVPDVGSMSMPGMLGSCTYIKLDHVIY